MCTQFQLRVGKCPHTDKPVVQYLDSEEDEWLCCHNDEKSDDLHDVAVYKKDTDCPLFHEFKNELLQGLEQKNMLQQVN